MTIHDYPRLCGGTFFTLVLQDLRQRMRAREHYKGESDGLILTSIFIAPGEIGNQVIESKDAQLLESQRLFLSYALQVTDIRLQISHITPNKPRCTGKRPPTG